MKFLLNSVEVDKDTFLSKVHALALQHELYHMDMAKRFGIPIMSLSAIVTKDLLAVSCIVKPPTKKGLELILRYAPYMPHNFLDMIYKIAGAKDSAIKRLRAIRAVVEYGIYEILDFIFKLQKRRIFLWVK